MTLFARLPLVLCSLLPALHATSAAADVRIDVHDADAPARITAPAGSERLASAPALVLPYFGVDAGNVFGETTLFAVRNNGARALIVRFSYYGAGGGEPLKVEDRRIAGRAVHTVNLRSVEGLPGDGNGIARGFVVAEPLDDAVLAAALSGDYFRVDPGEASADGGDLLPVEMTDCRRWSHRFLDGGPFDGGTRIAVLALDRPADGPTLAGNVYDEQGELVSVVTVTADRAAFELAAADLGLPVAFGSIDWVFQGGAHGAISTTFSASGLFSVGTEAACVDDLVSNPDPDPEPDPDPGTVRFELPGTFLTCNGCGNWQYDMPFGGNRQFSKVVLDFDVQVGNYDPYKPDGFHCIFWLNNGPRWQEMMGYLNSRGTRNRTVFQVNGPLGNPIGVESYASPGVLAGERYHVHYEYDTVEGIVWYEIRTTSGDLRVSDLIRLPAGAGPVNTNYTFIQFGSQPGGFAESLTEGWSWSDFTIDFIP